MPKEKAKGRAAIADPRQQGLRAFAANSFDVALACWSSLDASDPQVAAALAETHFRRALTRSADPTSQITDLRYALKLVPDEVRYLYHFGMALHRGGHLQDAIRNYRELLQQRPGWAGAGVVLALAELAQKPQVKLAELPGSTPEVRAALAPVQALLLGETPPAAPGGANETMQTLWQGLAGIVTGDGSALTALSDDKPLPTARAVAVRRIYKGVAAAQQGDIATALKQWQRVQEDGVWFPAWLLDNMVSALVEQLQSLIASDDTLDDDTINLVCKLVKASVRHSALNPLLLQALDRAAQQAVAAGDWQYAILLWEDARQLVSSSSNLGSPRPLLHNLALGYEMLEEWATAADMWRAMLRTRPRKTKQADEEQPAADPLAYTDEQWAWIRKRVITCYKQAGEPGEAVKVFRQAIKADPNDLDMRIQLADALLANDQYQASFNELQRILQVDPKYIEAHLRLAEMHSESDNWGAAERSLHIVLEQQPEREDIRRQIVRLTLQRGNHFHAMGMMDAARRIFQEGQAFDPTDYQFPLNLARIAIDERKYAQATELLEQTLELAGDNTQAYVYAIDCWVVASKRDEARALLERAERDLTLTPDFYIELGTQLLTRSTPQPEFPMLFGGEPKAKPRPDTEAWRELALNVLQRGVALKPDDARVHIRIATELLLLDSAVALEHAERATQLVPDEPGSLILLGLLQGLNDKARDAKATLRNAARLARQQGKPELAQNADQLREQVGTPFLRFSLQMQAMGDMYDDDLDDFYF